MLNEPVASAYLKANIIEVKNIVLAELQELSVKDVKNQMPEKFLKKVNKCY